MIGSRRDSEWIHNFSKKHKPVCLLGTVCEAPQWKSLLCKDNDRMCQSKAGHGIFRATGADGDRVNREV